MPVALLSVLRIASIKSRGTPLSCSVIARSVEKTAVSPGHGFANYGRDVVALGDMEHRTSKLFEAAGEFLDVTE